MTERGVYSDQDIVGALKAVDANLGYVKPTAAALGIPEKTLWNWTHRGGKRALAARRRLLGGNEDSAIADRYMDIVIAAQDRTMEALPKASAYQAVMIGAVAFDKRQLGLGRPTSRSVVGHVRLVEGDPLRVMAGRVIEVVKQPALPARSGQDHTPKVAGQVKMSYPLRQSTGTKAKRELKPKRSKYTEPVQASTRYVKISRTSPPGGNESAPESSPLSPDAI